LLLKTLQLEAVVITLNEQGAYLATKNGDGRLLSTRPRQVADATGAGDQVLATLCVARAAGASWTDAVSLANVASGIEVERLGCVPIACDEIIHDLLLEHHEQGGKERALSPLIRELDRHRAMGKRIVFTNGCFDLIHLGHVKYFQFAKAQGDLLVVGVNTDASIRRLKGAKRPVMDEHDRIGVLEELKSIDYLVRFEQNTPLELIHQIRPDVLVKGADYTKQQVVGWDFVESYGGSIALAPLVDGRSTSALIERIVESASDPRE
jgi:D-beta-D-heptose 7-phosphate kinase/D-beta-D-heptose 1-phosphate adenosyltransferase